MSAHVPLKLALFLVAVSFVLTSPTELAQTPATQGGAASIDAPLQ